MEYILVIVESPAKCKKIEQYLNKGNGKVYKCLASYGHIRELAGGLAAIDIHNNFAPTFIECVSKKDQISKLKKAIRCASEIILASDDDREGEAIAWHLCQVFHLPLETTKRIIFHEITESALHRAIETPGRVTMPVVNAQLARQVLDLLVGYTLSPLLWKHVKDGLSAGRCQTPALRLIYDNQREIETATGKQSYTVIGYFTNKNIPFVLNHEETDEVQLQEFLKESLIFLHSYKECNQHNKSRNAPEPFTTSSLQQTASNELHLSPKETMSLCQSLYEGGYITYHRTDSRIYSQEFSEKADTYIAKTYGGEYVRQPTTATNTTATNTTATLTNAAHEAIRITDLKCETPPDDANDSAKEVRLYRLIRRRTLESCMPAATVSVLSATITAPQKKEYHYTAELTVFAGWKIVTGKNGDEGKNEYIYLQNLKTYLHMPYQKIKATMHLKEMKTHYTEARLVQLLEEKGIGRPSTFSSLIEKIQERKYVKKENISGKTLKCRDYEIGEERDIKQIISEREFGNEKNKLVIQPVGILALEFLLKHYDSLFQYAYTQQMENALDAVARDEKKWYEVCQNCYIEMSNLSASILEKGKETIRIDGEHIYMIGKYGPVIKCINEVKATEVKATEVMTKKKIYKKGNNTEVTFKAVRKDIDLNKLRRGEYTLQDILEKTDAPPHSIGMYKDKPVYIKVGQFGKYLEWNSISKSLKHLKQQPAEITLDDVSELLYDNEDNVNLRIIGDDASIRKGKYGHYIYYKNKKMKKPRFLKLDGFIGDFFTCDLLVLQEWFKNTYKIDA